MKRTRIPLVFQLIASLFTGSDETTPAKRRQSVPTKVYSTRHKVNKVTRPDSKGDYRSNVQDSDLNKVAEAMNKRTRKKEKRYSNAFVSAYNNACVSLAYADKYRVAGLIKAL